MADVNSEFLINHKNFRIKNKKLYVIFLVLAVIVAIVVFWWLKLVGITITGDAFCGLDEHSHTEECYSTELICDSKDTEDSSDASVNEVHGHNDSCYKQILICTQTEHTHTVECFPDTSADTEQASDWMSTLEDVEITNNIPENLIAVAMSQMGYEESKKNFEFDTEGNRNGYTRYGEWYGNPYGKWNGMFISFCLHYSNINNADELKGSGAEALRIAWKNRYVYSPADEYTPQRGDILFEDTNGDGSSDSVGIILSADKSNIIIVKGDSNNKVETVIIANFDNIIGYGLTSELCFAKDMEYLSEIAESTTSEVTTEAEAPPLMMFSTGSPKANITYIEDLTLAIANVVFRTQDGVVIDNGSTVYIGQSYVVSLEFSEINTGDEWIQFQHNEQHILHYQIPKYLHCEPFDSWHPISAKTENGTVEDVGEYFVDEHGYLRVRFYDDENGVCFGSKYSNVDFVIDFNATVGESASDSSTEIKFNDEIKVNLNVDGNADMDVTKTHGTYDSETHTVDYTITVRATKGVVKDLVIDDQIWENHSALRDTILVTDLDGNVLDPQPVISDHPNQYATGGFRLSGFPDFKAGDGYLITYKSQIYDYLLSNETVEMWNGIDATGKNSNPTDNTVYKWAEDWQRVELEKMEKDGRQSVLEDDDGNSIPVIEWEVEIIKNNHNLQGTVIIDTLGEGLVYYTEKDIRVKRYDEWGNRLSDIYISWNDVTLNGNSMSFDLPDGYGFDIVYYTTYELPDEGEEKHYTNSVRATINGKEETAGGDADVVGFVPMVSKSARGNDGEYVYFTVEADIPAVIKDRGHFYLTDLAAFWGYNNAEGHLYVENIPEDIVITATTESGRTITFTPYVQGGTTENTYILISPANGNEHHSFNILFNTADPTFASSKWTLNEDAKLTVTYKIPFDAKTGTEWTGELTGDLTLEDVLLSGYKMANEAYVNYTDIIQGTGTTTYEYSPIITKKSIVNEDGTIDYTVVFNNTIPGSSGNSGYVDGTIDKVWFNDAFDERLEYVPDSLIVTGYSPWQKDLWLVKYKYNGTVTGNTMEISSTDMLFYDYNEDADAYGWNGISGTTTFRNYYRWVNAGGKFVFTYKLRVKDEYLYTTEHSVFELDNTAELTWDNGGSSGPVTERSEYETGLIDKHVVQENNKLNFDIHINRNALDILPGTDTLTIEDTMIHSLSVYWDSIKLLYEDENGNWIDFDSYDSIHKYTVTYDQTINKLTFVVPDELHIRIDYTTLITESGLVSVKNSVKIDGKAQVSDIIDAIFKVEEHSGGASGSIHNITLLKQDGITDAPLSNAAFLLYGPMGDPDAVLPSGAAQHIVSDDGRALGYIGTYITGADGTVNIETQYLTLGGPYALIEKTAPEGYELLDSPVYFYFYEADPNGLIQTVTTLITVENFSGSFIIPETGGTGILPFTIIGVALTAFPILYSTIRRKRERRFL